MNRRMIVAILCMILRIEAALMIPALAIAIYKGEHNAVLGFLVAMAACLLFGMLTYLRKPERKAFYAREGFLIVALGWLAVSLFGALPFWVSREIPSLTDCIFETVSGFTTTGASILSDVEALPLSLLYWRSFTHWVGGMGVLVFILAIIPMMRNTGHLMHLLRAESPGPQVDKLVPRIQNSAKILYGIYIGMTLLQIVLLLAGGMPLFDSVATAFGTAGTGGFGIKNDSMAGYSTYIQAVTTVFMALFGVNFNIFYLLLIREFSKAFRNSELRLYLALMLGSIAVITWNVLPMFQGNFGQALHHVSFQVSSIMTTTGFSTVDFNLWPPFSRMVLVVLMILGACAGSTGGGIKTARVLLLFKAVVRDVKRMLRPRSVATVQVEGRAVGDDTMRGVYNFMTLYCIISIASILLISLDNFSMITNITAVIACLNNIGPGLDVVGPMGNYAEFSDISKLILSANMLIGRLEIFPMLMLVVPAAWRR